MLVNGKQQSTFPLKNQGFEFESVTCTNGATGTWNVDAWNVTIDNLEASTTCSINFSAKLCKRALKLHEETCIITDESHFCRDVGYAYGETIQYGNVGIAGELNTGDAFDCDVNEDGFYNSETERFYYVSDYYNTETNEFDTNYATLIYYNFVSNGKPNNQQHSAYNLDTSGYLGPQTGIIHLPKWSGVNLKSSRRNIQDNSNAIRVSGFSYGDYTTRLLTYQETKKGCLKDADENYSGNFYLNGSCEFLLENSYFSGAGKVYGTWLESASNEFSDCAMRIYSDTYNIAVGKVNSTTAPGIKPAIEVLKSNISY